MAYIWYDVEILSVNPILHVLQGDGCKVLDLELIQTESLIVDENWIIL